jgi:hypothetical protein
VSEKTGTNTKEEEEKQKRGFVVLLCVVGPRVNFADRKIAPLLWEGRTRLPSPLLLTQLINAVLGERNLNKARSNFH